MSFENAREICSVCGATLKVERITYIQTVGDKVYIINDVPAHVCLQCGEEYLSPSTVDAIQEAVESGRPTRTVQVPVFDFASASF